MGKFGTQQAAWDAQPERPAPGQATDVAQGAEVAIRPPLVSLIVTNYNYERFIGDCLASIASQTYENIEVIVVDDQSSDNSLARAQEFIDTHPRGKQFRTLALARNGGQMNAFIEGYAEAKGAFIVFVDADDLLFPEFVERHLQAHLNPEYVAGMTCSNEVIIDGDNRVIASSIEKWHRAQEPAHRLAPDAPVFAATVEDWENSWSLAERAKMNRPAAPLRFIEPDGNQARIWLWSTTSAVMFRRGVLDLALVDDIRDVRICADYILFHVCQHIGGTLLINTPLGAYRRHGENNFAKNVTIGRGSKAGDVGDGPSFGDLDRRIQRLFLAHYEKMVAILGEPRMMQILASIVPLRRFLPVFWKVGGTSISTKLQFLVLYLIRFVRKMGRIVIRKLSFA